MADPRPYQVNGHNVTIADSANITREECLVLARCGVEAWNTWRRSNPVSLDILNHKYRNKADFSNFNFRANPIDFSNFRFEDGAQFCDTVFGSRVNFNGVQFGDSANFEGARFEGGASFRDAHFGQGSKFSKTQFIETADFIGVRFDAGTSFDSAHFFQAAKFHGAQFGNYTSFNDAQFGSFVDFDGALFGDITSFDGVQFSGAVSFAAKLSFPRLLGHDYEQRKRRSEADGNIPGGFQRVSFQRTTFCDSVSFSGRNFAGATFFSGSVFNVAPNFHSCRLNQNTSFDAKFPLVKGDENASRAYRTLKLAFAQQQAIREEQRFFKLEMQEEAARETGWRRWLYCTYSVISDFGFSISRPLLLLALTTLVATLIYANQAGLTFDFSGSHTAALIQFSIASAIPGLDKLAEPAAMRLFGDLAKGVANYNLWVVLTLLAHKAVSLLALFLIGLALRNLFKMK